MKTLSRIFCQVVVLICCGMMVGCGYRSEFSCQGNPDAGECRSVPAVYHLGGASPLENPGNRSGAMDGTQWAGVNGSRETIVGKPIVNLPVVYNAWIAPWKDQSGTRVFEGSTVYLLVKGPAFNYGHSGVSKTGDNGSLVIVPSVYPLDKAPAKAGIRSSGTMQEPENPNQYVNRALQKMREMKAPPPPRVPTTTFRPAIPQKVKTP